MAIDFKYRIHEVAKDFGMTSKVIGQILTDYSAAPKNHMQVLEENELDLIFEYLTQHNQVGSIAEIFAPDPEAKPKAAPAPAAEPAKADAASAKPQAAAPAAPAVQSPAQQTPAKPKENKPHQPRQVAEKRVVDTRGSSGANLSKYDERFDNMAGERAQNMQRQGKEKIPSKNKNKQRQQPTSGAKRRQEERERMQRLQFEIAKKAPVKVRYLNADGTPLVPDTDVPRLEILTSSMACNEGNEIIRFHK